MVKVTLLSSLGSQIEKSAVRKALNKAVSLKRRTAWGQCRGEAEALRRTAWLQGRGKAEARDPGTAVA